jgi:photosystem II stability/assembly factor-like uncharacterized protein
VADVACVSPAACAAAVDLADGTSVVLVTGDGGQTWSSSGPLPSGFVPAVHQGLVCALQACVLVGGDDSTPPVPMALTSADGGLTWSAGTPLHGLAVVDAVQCPTVHRCIAAGQSPAPDGSGSSYGPALVLTSGDGGRTWSATAATGLPAAIVYSLSCSSRSRCAVGGALSDAPVDTGYAMVARTTDGGSNFSVASLPAADGAGHALDYDAVLSLTCNPGTCVALAALSSATAGSARAQAVLSG